ncbi:hypothetical protein SAMN05216499_116126 [Actinacidiphila paucisporea]|uniref:Uncharacterized protein n=1 Tax=Actinacidiphila paucisporea TaxID=310782 RepID=A0A1M7MP77_9ACTN|nr:hypothetical protein SAMN05216499_116126 [Actinacidiphila paucisporea]
MPKKWWIYVAAALATTLTVLLSLTASSSAGPRYHSTPDAEEHEEVVAKKAATTGSCGVERWSVKTGTDADAGSITLQSTSSTTIASLGALTAPSSLPANNRVKPTETTVFTLSATLTQYKLEADSDYHLVLNDTSGHTMIAEIPDPACVGAGSPLLSGIQKARGEFDSKYSVTGSFQTANVPVTVTGVGFFDFKHGQTGVAPNGIELHSVLDIRFGGGTTGGTTGGPTGGTTGGTGGCTPSQLLGNPGFEAGTASPWTAGSGVVSNNSSEPAHTGSWDAWLDGYGTTHTDTLSQPVTIPTACTTASFTFYLHIDSAETSTSTAYDKLTVQVGSTTLATYSNINKITGYVQKSFNLAAYAGQTVTLKFTGTEDSTLQTSFVIDDTAVNVS